MNPPATLSVPAATLPTIAPRLGGTILTIGIEQEGVRVGLIEPVSGQHRLVGWLGLQNDQGLEVAPLIAQAVGRLGMRLGRRLWDAERHEPFQVSEDPLRYPPLDAIVVAMMPRPRLRVWLAGLSQSYTLAALRQALAAAPVEIVGMSTLEDALVTSELTTAWSSGRPEALIVAGGFDEEASAAQQPLRTLCQQIGQAVSQLPAEGRPALFFAGNRFVAPAAAELLRGAAALPSLTVVMNVQPAPGWVRQTPLVTALSFLYWQLSERTVGASRISRWVTPPSQLSSLVTNFAQLVRIWLEQHQLAEVHARYATKAWACHVWARLGDERLQLCYVEPNRLPEALAHWPPLQLVSGDWPAWLPATVPAQQWWDRQALAPLIATVGQVAPLAMLQVLTHDVFETRQ